MTARKRQEGGLPEEGDGGGGIEVGVWGRGGWVGEDGSKGGAARDDDDDDDDDHDDAVAKDGEEEDDEDDDDQGLIDRGSTSHQFLFSFERETRCSKRFPRRRGRLDKAEEAE
ncbi:unnamed protein product [Xylocopa violacea]|uniref:Uncharacterized protein n=1 Tax=Xylocopa violacea TaxID=135666 RepID=A0ABP1NMT2_XYLVO